MTPPIWRSPPTWQLSSVDLTSAIGRWPRRRCAAWCCAKLVLDEDTLASLNLCADTSNAFNDRARQLGGIFASHAAIAFSAAQADRKIEQLHRALVTSRRIVEAMGILMRGRIPSEDAA